MMAGVESLVWILVGGLLMSADATTGALMLALSPATLERLLLPFVALAYFASFRFHVAALVAFGAASHHEHPRTRDPDARTADPCDKRAVPSTYHER